MNLFKIFSWFAIAGAGTKYLAPADAAPLNSNNYNPCNSANYNAALRGGYENLEQASRCSTLPNGKNVYLCNTPPNKTCRPSIGKIDESYGFGYNRKTGECAKITYRAGKNQIFENREDLIKCPPSDKPDAKFRIKVGNEGDSRLCPIDSKKPCDESKAEKLETKRREEREGYLRHQFKGGSNRRPYQNGRN